MSNQMKFSSNTIYDTNSVLFHLSKTNHYVGIIDKKTKTIIKITDIGEGIPILKEGWVFYTTYRNKTYLSTEKTIIEYKIK